MIPVRSLVGAVAIAVISSVAQAQSAQPALGASFAEPSAFVSSPVNGPRSDALRVGIVASPAVEAAPMVPAPMRRSGSIKGRNLMIIGGAAILGGAIVGGDAGSIVSLGGLGVGLYGLYLYLN